MQTYLLPQCVLLVVVTFAGLELLDALVLLHDLFVVASFLLDQSRDGARCDGEFGGWCHVGCCSCECEGLSWCSLQIRRVFSLYQSCCLVAVCSLPWPTNLVVGDGALPNSNKRLSTSLG